MQLSREPSSGLCAHVGVANATDVMAIEVHVREKKGRATWLVSSLNKLMVGSGGEVTGVEVPESAAI